jgi:LCP family protein required for cell wall assembly
MKSAKYVYKCSFIIGIILFIVGISFLNNSQKISSKPHPQPQQVSEDTSKPEVLDMSSENNESAASINFLLLVKEASGLNTDTIIVANYDPSTRQISMLNVPRDTKPGSKASYKVNSCYSISLNKSVRSTGKATPDSKRKAVEYTAQAVSNLTGISIDYYAYIEIDTIKQIVDKLGGVYFDVPADIKYTDPTQNLYINLKKGYQLLDGNKAEQLMRFRKPQGGLRRASEDVRKYYDGSDLKRTEMQIKFLNELIQQKVTLFQLPKLIPVVNYAFGNIITNISLTETLSLVDAFTKETRPTINTFRLSGLDRTINKEYFYIYNDKIEDTKTRQDYDSKKIIATYFKSASGLFVPDPDKKYDFKSILADNPSNSDTDVKKDSKDKP